MLRQMQRAHHGSAFTSPERNNISEHDDLWTYWLDIAANGSHSARAADRVASQLGKHHTHQATEFGRRNVAAVPRQQRTLDEHRSDTVSVAGHHSTIERRRLALCS